MILILGALLLSGCAAGPLGGESLVGAYLRDRGNDALDVFRFSAGTGIGYGVEVKATSFFNPSFGVAASTCRIGVDSRDTAGWWYEEESFFPASLQQAGWIAGRTTYMREIGFDREMGARSSLLWSAPKNYHSWKSPVWRISSSLTDFELGADVLLVSARAGVNAAEALDFVLGLFALDIGEDDDHMAHVK